jgi:hypothetical protein
VLQVVSSQERPLLLSRAGSDGPTEVHAAMHVRFSRKPSFKLNAAAVFHSTRGIPFRASL